MTPAEFDKRLAAHGWRYDVDNEQFMNGKHALNYRTVLALTPGMTLDELAATKTKSTHARSVAKRRTAKKAMPKHKIQKKKG